MQRLENYGSNLVCCLIYKLKFTETQPHPLVSTLSMIAFILQYQRSTVMTEIMWPVKPKISEPLQKKFAIVFKRIQ